MNEIHCCSVLLASVVNAMKLDRMSQPVIRQIRTAGYVVN